MSRSVDERVVEMGFDNREFERNVATSMGTIDRLKKKLNFDDVSNSIENLNRSTRGIDTSGLSGGFLAASSAFSNFENMVQNTILFRAINQIIDRAKELGKSIFISPAKQGFEEYELEMTSVQTMMESTGEPLDVVMAKLEELNKYADDTIYSFSDMTSNIGKFTNAGVDLNTAVAAIKGISNAAALSGANTWEASRAMYNFAQAISTGYVQLIDWKSIELANMATKEFKQQLIDTAVEFGTLEKAGDNAYRVLTTNNKGDLYDGLISSTKGFRETLNYQWLTTEVLNETLGRYADETTDIGKRATAAATQVKTFTQLISTLKEAVGTGWAESFRLIFGDFEEARELWTGVSNAIGGVISKHTEMRNSILREWKELGGRDDLINAFSNIWKAIESIINPIKEAFRNVFPSKAVERLKNFTQGFEGLTERLIISEEAGDKLRDVFEKIFSAVKKVLDFVKMIIPSGEDLKKVFSAVGDALSYVFRFLSSVVDFIKANFGDDIQKVFSNLRSNFEKLAGRMSELVDKVRAIVQVGKDEGKNAFQIFGEVGGYLVRGMINGVATAIPNMIKGIREFCNKIWNYVTEYFDVNSPSKKFIWLASMLVLGFAVGFKGGIKEILSGIVSFCADVLSAFNINLPKGAFEKIGSDSIEGFGEGLSETAGTVASGIKTFFDGFLGVFNSDWNFGDTAIANAPENVSNAVHGIGESISSAVGSASSIVKKVLDKLETLLGPVFDKLAEFVKNTELVEAFKNILHGLGDAIKWFFDGEPWAVITKIVSAGTLIVIGKQVLDFYKMFKQASAGFAGILANFSGLIGSAKGTVDSFNNLLKGGIFGLLYGNNTDKLSSHTKIGTFFREVADSLLSVAKAILIIAVLPDDKMKTALAILKDFFTSFVELAAAPLFITGKAASRISQVGKAISDIGRSLMYAASALVIIAFALRMATKLAENENIDEALKLLGIMIGGVVAMFAIFAGISALMKKSGGEKEFDKIGKAISKASWALIIIGVALAIVAAVAKGGYLEEAVLSLSLILGAMTLCIAVLALAGAALGEDTVENAGKIFAKIGWAVLLISVALAILGALAKGDVLIDATLALLSIMGIMSTIVAAFAFLDSIGLDVKAAAIDLVIMSASLVILAAAMMMVASIPSEALGNALAALVTGLVAILAAGAIAGIPLVSEGLWTLGLAIALVGAGALLAGAGMVMLAGALTIIVKLGSENLLDLAAGLGAIAAAVTVAGNPLALVGMLTMAGTLPIIAASAVLVGVGLKAISSALTSLSKIGSSKMEQLKSFSDVIMTLSLVKHPLALASLTGVSVALVAFGVGVVAAGAGLVVFAGALTTISLVMPIISGGLVILAAGFKSFGEVTTRAVSNFTRLSVALGILAVSLESMSGTSVIVGIATLSIALGALGDNASKVGMSIASVVSGALLLSNLPVGTIAANLAMATTLILMQLVLFIHSVEAVFGISSPSTVFAEIGVNLILGLINGMMSGLIAIRATISMLATTIVLELSMRKADFKRIGSALIDGLREGISSKAKDLNNTLTSVIGGGVNVVLKLLRIGSPSKVFNEIGQFSGMGLVDGLIGMTSKVMNAAGTLGESAIVGMQSAVSRIASAIDSNIDYQPRIAPVLDLSNVKKGASTISTLLNRDQAMTIGSTFGANADADQNEVSAGTSYSFVQNNYSPKALSRIDIYRQTKNQFAAIERMGTT